MEAKIKSSILISIFKRKGAEGQFTKIIYEHNESEYAELLSSLEKDEKGLIIYYRNELDWLLLTNKRVLTSSGVSILNVDITDVSLALQEEFRNMVTDKNRFTRLLVKDRHQNSYIFNLEMGAPYKGFYQVLHFIAGNQHI